MNAPRWSLVRRIGCFGLLGLIACGCAQPTPITEEGPIRAEAIWWAPALGLTSLAAIDQALAKPFDGPYDVFLTLKGAPPKPAVVKNCETYFQLREAGYEPLSENDLAAMRLEGARCHAIRALRAARPASRNSLDGFRFDGSALSLLPPAMGPENSPVEVEARQTATRKGASWRDLDRGASITSTGPNAAKVLGSDWSTELELLGRADFNGDGSDDLLMRSLSYGKEGSWHEVRLRLLSRFAGKAVLTIVDEKKL